MNTHASDATKVDFIRRLAGSSTDQPRVRTMNEDRVYDPQARAIAEVLGGLQHNPAAAELAFESLRPEQVREVLNAATREVQLFAFAFGGGSSVTFADASTFDAVMTAASRIGDADTKARIFDEGVAELKDLESRGLDEAAEVARNGLTRLLMSDTNGVMRELAYNKETFDGSALAYYMKSMLNAGEAARLGEIQAQILTGNQRDTGDPVARFEELSSTASGHDRYANAEVAGYFAGAVTSAARSITDDARQQAELLTAVFKSALTVIDKSNVGRSLGAGPGVAKEWVQFPVRAAMDALIAGRVDAADAMVLSMQPTRDVEKLPNGTVDIEDRHRQRGALGVPEHVEHGVADRATRRSEVVFDRRRLAREASMRQTTVRRIRMVPARGALVALIALTALTALTAPGCTVADPAPAPPPPALAQPVDDWSVFDQRRADELRIGLTELDRRFPRGELLELQIWRLPGVTAWPQVLSHYLKQPGWTVDDRRRASAAGVVPEARALLDEARRTRLDLAWFGARPGIDGDAAVLVVRRSRERR